ncbi:DUF4360 domain-containing protein [Nostoc sp. XA010]|uniref:DUF4360 domain-containing protein n=1 Tax=Nostoc sp. XA010 TaxID=2780407 RepID=UPI001E40A162|nr:DUF4360 domain-containing protein [Nostoc sp. XA010]MCC5656553.1 DUF4360 domain-containing protein [Nostoc sp. XA010]
MKTLTGLISSLTLLSLNVVGLSQVQAQTTGLIFNQNVPVSFSGTGCPSSNTIQGVLNGDTLSITFSALEAKASRPNVVSKSCNFRIGLNVPSGFNVQPIQLKYFVFKDVPRGGSGDASVKVVFPGEVVQPIENPNRTFMPGFSDTGIIIVDIKSRTINACSRAVNSVFGINSTLRANARNIPANQETQIRIDPIETTIGDVLFQIKFDFNPC